MMFWSDGVMDGPVFAALNGPVSDALLEYRFARLPAAQSIAAMNNYDGAYWPWQSAVTGFERSCGNVSTVLGPKGCYWMHEIHVGADVALSFKLAYFRKALNGTFLRELAWPVVSATADFFSSRANVSDHPSKNWTLLGVIGPDEHSYIVDSNTYTNAAAGMTIGFAIAAANTLGLKPPTLAAWENKAGAMLIPTAQYCKSWPNASVDGCPPEQRVTIHPQYDGYHGQDINQADAALMQWPLHLSMDRAVAAADLEYYGQRSSGADTKGFFTGDSSVAISYLFLGGHRAEAEQQTALAFDHMLGPFNIWSETDPKVAAHNSTGNLNFLTGAGR
jgi:trehalose/maltose hydrolase-like predicted phosphorylase